jgi:hypothetical protein
MACIIYFAQPLAMATTQLARVIRYERLSTWQLEKTADRKVPRMSWVVVTDSNGNRKLEAQWTS